MFNKNSIEIIRGIGEINNKTILEYPRTTISNVTKDINGIVDFSILGDSFDTIGIWDLSSFLNALSVLEDPVITLDNNIITAKDEYSSISYVTSSTNILGDAVCDPAIVTSTLGIPSIVDVNMTTDVVNRIKKGVNVFKNLKDLRWTKSGDIFTVSTTNKESFNASSNSFQLKLDTDKLEGPDFEITIPAENFLQLPSIDFDFKVHEKSGQHRISMSNAIYKFVLSLSK